VALLGIGATHAPGQANLGWQDTLQLQRFA
jgi:hypothetical protein